MENQEISLHIKRGDLEVTISGSRSYINGILGEKELKAFVLNVIEPQKLSLKSDLVEQVAVKLDSYLEATLAEFATPLVDDGRIKTTAEKIALFGYYYEIVKKQSEFDTQQILDGFKAIRDKLPGNIHRDFQTAMSGKTPYVVRGEKSRHFRLTRTGIELVKSKLLLNEVDN